MKASCLIIFLSCWLLSCGNFESELPLTTTNGTAFLSSHKATTPPDTVDNEYIQVEVEIVKQNKGLEADARADAVPPRYNDCNVDPLDKRAGVEL